MRKDVLLLFILTQPSLHSKISVKCLGIGKHVFCIAPIGIGATDAEKMVHASEYYPKLISIVNHPHRFLPSYVHLKKALNEKLIGEVQLIDINIRLAAANQESYDWIHDTYMVNFFLQFTCALDSIKYF